MNEKIRKLRQERAAVVVQMREMLDGAEKEKRDLNGDETTKYETMEKELQRQEKEIEREERLYQIETGLKNQSNVPPPANDGTDAEQRVKKQNVLFSRFLQYGKENLSGEEIRALQADSETVGGFLTAPQQFVATLIKAVDNLVVMRQFATVISVTKAASLGIPSLDADPADCDWTKEIATGSEDSTMAFGKRELFPHPLAKLLKVSEKLLRVSALDVESLVRERLAYKFAVTHENCFLNGSGSNQPLGLFTASADGIPTTRDVSTGNTATTIGCDGLIDALYSLKSQYIPRARWIFHRDAIKQIRKLKDGEGQYIWQAGVAADRPDAILGRPYTMSEYCPNTFTTTLYVGIVGDMSFYWICDALDMRIQRLNELYAAASQVGFIGRLETDAMPVLAEAFARVKLG